MKKGSLVVLALLGVISYQQVYAATNTQQVERYFPHHSWEKVNPSEFMKNLNQEVEAEKKQQQSGGQAKPNGGQQMKQSSSENKQKGDASMIQQEQSDEQFTAHELAIQLKQSMQNALTDMGVEYKDHDTAQNDLIQVTADDFDHLDHLNSNNHKNSKNAMSNQQQNELNQQKVAHIARMEEKLTERINLLMNSSHRTDSDEGELEDVFQEVKPINKLNIKLAQAQDQIKETQKSKKFQRETFAQLDNAFEDLKNLVDQRKQRLVQIKQSRKHHGHHSRDMFDQRDLQEATPRNFIPTRAPQPRHMSQRTHNSRAAHMSQQYAPQMIDSRFAAKPVRMQFHNPTQTIKSPTLSEADAEQDMPTTQPMESEPLVKPHSIPDPMNQFSIPNHELRLQKKEHLDKLEEEVQQEKDEREITAIARSSKSIIDFNKKKLVENEAKYNKLHRKDILSRQDLHKTLKKQGKKDKMQKDLDEQMEVENTIKRANQITSAVKNYEDTEFNKGVVSEAEDDFISKEDKENERLEKQLNKDLEKEEKQKETKKKEDKVKQQQAQNGLQTEDKQTQPEQAQKKVNVQKPQSKMQKPMSLVEQSSKSDEETEDKGQENASEGEQEKTEDDQEKTDTDQEKTESDDKSEEKENSQENKEVVEPEEKEETDQPKEEKKKADKKSGSLQKSMKGSSNLAETAGKKKKVKDQDEVDEKEFNSFAEHAMDALKEAKKLEVEFDDLQKQE